MHIANTASNTESVVSPAQLFTPFSPTTDSLDHDYIENAEFVRTILEQALLAKNISVYCDCV